jgi:hypothetical protein
VLTEEQGRGPWRRHVGVATVVAGRPPSRGCDSKGGDIVLAAERPSTALEATLGLQAAVQPTRRRRATASTKELGRKLQQSQPEQIKPQERDPLDGAQRRWRRLKARSTNPRGQEEAHGEAEQMRHRAAAKLAGARRNRVRNSSTIRNHQRGLGLGANRVGKRVRGGQLGRAGPVKPTWVD